MKRNAIWGLLAGLLIVCMLFAWRGLGPVAELFAAGGWALLGVCLFAPFEQVMGAEAYRRLFAPRHRPAQPATLLASWMGSAVNTLLPVATIGGEVVKARVLVHWGAKAEPAVAAMVVDKTVQAVVVLAWGLVGIVALTLISDEADVIAGALAGAAGLAAGIGGFVWVQLKGGAGFMARAAGRARSGDWGGLIETADDVDAEIRAAYGRPVAVAAGVAIRLATRVVLVGEIILAAHLMGHPIGLVEAVMLKALVVGIRGIGFAVPGGWGVQEGGYIAIGALIGLPPDLMLAVSLATRVREILPNIPLLFYWQFHEGRRHWRRSRAETADRRDVSGAPPS